MRIEFWTNGENLSHELGWHFIALPPTAFVCGKERWPVKVSKDSQKNLLFKNNNISTKTLKNTQETTVKDLRAFAYAFGDPAAFPSVSANNERSDPVETTIRTIAQLPLTLHQVDPLNP